MSIVQSVPFRMTKGCRFARPYESEYSVLRRFYIVNQGVTPSMLSLCLKQMYPEIYGFSSRFFKFVAPPIQYCIIDYDYYQWQCPVCAKEFYHTGLFGMPWLTHCPIHHCEIVSICPTCQRPWPSIKELHERDCPTCGVLSINDFAEELMQDIKQNRYQIIADMCAYLLDKKHRNHKSDDNAYNVEEDHGFTISGWAVKVPFTSERYPAFMLRHHPDHSYAALKKTGMPAYHINRKIATLHPKRKDKAMLLIRYIWEKPDRHRDIEGKLDICKLWPEYTKEEINDYIKANERIYTKDLSHRTLRADFLTMRRIVAWIARHATCGHIVHLNTYRFMRLADWKNVAMPPCPYCMALSLWFYHTAAWHYGHFIGEYVDQYSFCEELGLGSLIVAQEPVVKYDGKEYKTDPLFACWYYRRQLELSFLVIQRFIFTMLGLIVKFNTQTSWPMRLNSRYRDYIPDLFYSADLISNKLHFYYENARPLDAYTPKTVPDYSRSCEAFHDTYPDIKSDASDGHLGEIRYTNLTYDTFLKLHDNFRRFAHLKNPRKVKNYYKWRVSMQPTFYPDFHN